MTHDDPMWREFQPLWSELQFVGNQVHLAGGYGLFLKQRWLLANRDYPTVIPLENWLDPTPRRRTIWTSSSALPCLQTPRPNGILFRHWNRNEFKVVEQHPRWQFEKQLDPDRRVLVDLHAEVPEGENQNLALDKLRIKHKPSLGDEGVHGRRNPEAAGCSLHPFLFKIGEITISVPNPVTWSVMKLVSTRDRREKSEDADRDEAYRNFHHLEAMKHARDVARIVAMMTRDERERAQDVISEIREPPLLRGSGGSVRSVVSS